MRKKILLMVNPASGTGAGKMLVYDIVHNLTVNNCEVTVYPILPGNNMDSETLIHDNYNRFDVLACCGGDGTLNHLVGSVARLGITKPIGYIPSGSTNDFAKSLGLSDNLERNCAAIAGDHYMDYDIGRFNGEYFNYVAAFGAFTKVSYATNQAMKNAIGYAAYLLEGIMTLPESISTRCHLEIEHDGKREKGDFVFGAISNATSMGGIASPLMQKASLNDGVFEVMLISAPDNIAELGEILATLASGSTNNRYVKIFKTKKLNIIPSKRTDWTLDGEYGGKPEKVEIEVCPKKVRILLPEGREVRPQGLFVQ